MIATDRLMAPFLEGTTSFLHGYTFGGHPVSCAVAMANLDVFENEKVLEHVRANEQAFRATLEQLDAPWGSWVTSAATATSTASSWSRTTDRGRRSTTTSYEGLLRGFLSKALYDAGLYCRADDLGDPVIQLLLLLICYESHFDEIEQILRVVLDKAATLLSLRGANGSGGGGNPSALPTCNPRWGLAARHPSGLRITRRDTCDEQFSWSCFRPARPPQGRPCSDRR